ncbi:acyltransferase [Pedobacter sp. SD-b]|uniref:Acyltransferase n=1 Tax=Pedobacter segetis TaxID=2793069 RepID=A0ABS1BLX3_9SPHI|nr:acyltransferase [Pedobacter segetis]MBK0383813.1 acyltransferase [Pedobacter segetis]
MNHLAKENNNFNLVRLLACFQVLIYHSYSFYHKIDDTLFFKFIWLFPGVVIFFSISGFLIAKSFDYSSIKSFSIKRFLRIYPGLIVNISATFLLLYFLRFIKINLDSIKYFVSQLTIFQFYVPESFKKFGSGHHPNGALWTISVELQFYFLFLVTAILLGWKKRSIKFKNIVTSFLIIVSCLINFLSNSHMYTETISFKLLFNSIFYHFTFFGIGMLFWINFQNLKIIFIGKFKYWSIILMIIILMIIFFDITIRRYQYENLSFLYLLILVFTTFSFVFSLNGLSYRLLGKTDISYGTYIYHCLVINLFIILNVNECLIPLTWLISINLGLLSWVLIEKGFLAKKSSL